jgi:elongation factor 1-alpha
MTSVEEIQAILSRGETKNTEFKQKLTTSDLKTERKQKLVTRIRYMTCEAPFEGHFLIGIEDIQDKEWKIQGLKESKLESAEDILKEICDEANVEIIESERVETTKGMVGIYLLKRIAAPELKTTCSINVAGRVNSGKSTLVGALVTGVPDNGSGKARSFLLTHPQEITRGQTADIHLTFMGLSSTGENLHLINPLNKEESARVLDQAAKILTFFDAPGHQEYSKTMIRSILGADAQYGLVLIPGPEEANLITSEEEQTGMLRLDDITREHLILMASNDTPFIVAITKVDTTDEKSLALVNKIVRQSLKEIGRIPAMVSDESDIEPVIREIHHGTVVPLLYFAATEQQSLELMTNLLKKLPASSNAEQLSRPARAYIDKVYRGIRGTNVVVTGTVSSGVFKKGQEIIIGPDENGIFRDGRLFSIEMFKNRVERVQVSSQFGFDIKDVDKHQIRRGQVVADPDDSISGCRVFEANIVVTRHPTRISIGYSPVFQSHTIQQAVILRKIYDAEYLCVGDFARVQLEFLQKPEALELGDKIVLREANTRAIGTVVELLNLSD